MMLRLSFAAAALVLSAPIVIAQQPVDDLQRSRIANRAVEAVIWGMPAVNADLMLQTMLTKTKARENQILYWSRPVNWKNQTLTPNPDSIYFMSFWNLKQGPIVIEIPPAIGGSIAGNIVDAWQMPLEDAGPEGADAGKGGRYLLLPPGFSETIPKGYITLRPNTYSGFALMRSNLTSHKDEDIDKSVGYGRQIKIYPFAQVVNPPTTIFTDAFDVLFDSTIRYDASFFENLNRVVQKEPWLDRDRVMIDQLKTLGIEKGKPYKPSAEIVEILNGSARQARNWLAQKYDAGFPVINEGIRWFPAAMVDMVKAAQGGYSDANSYPVDVRAVTYTLGFTGIKRIGTAQFYLMANKDKDGNAFHGGKSYRLVVPADAPVKNYWSVTAYDRETHALIRDMDKASVASISPSLQKNADGSVDVFFGEMPPAGKEVNWVPVSSKGEFELLFRLYGPQKPLFDKTWKLPDVEVIK